MKFISATIKNFRLLKDLRLDFSTDPEKPLTVIRAHNESGKTTAETALVWGLYGSAALPGDRNSYPLCPSDAIVRGLKKVEVSVEIEFVADRVVTLKKGLQKVQSCHFRLKRKCIEYPTADHTARREGEDLLLYEVTSEGVIKVPTIEVESIIENSIPFALKDVYFTDGDRAMTFIEAAASSTVKRGRVRKAIEALLGLKVLENTITHTKSAARKFSGQIDNTNYKVALEQLNDRIDGYDEDIDEWSEELIALENAIEENELEFSSTQRKVEELVALGDREALNAEIRRIKRSIDDCVSTAEHSLKGLAGLTRDPNLYNSLVRESAQKGLDILNKLNEKKELPKLNIPILEDLLERNSKDCFCGESLDEANTEGQRRRAHIEHSIEKSRSADDLQEAASTLFFSVRSESFDETPTDNWMEKYTQHSSVFSNRKNDEMKYRSELKKKEAEIDEIEDSDIEILRIHQKTLRKSLDDARIRVGELTGSLHDIKGRRSSAEVDRSRLEKKAEKTDTSSDKLKWTRVCEGLFSKVYDRLRKEELDKVSSEMNRIFLEMIGADPEANDLTLITRAELTDQFDILVYGPRGKRLNPDQDLNGASRRALTLAFILALTKVSQVDAPNVIDTPLGMMSGFVKNSVLNKTLEEGSQVILFLTHDEISGVENTLDKKAGVVFTLTNPAHYPKMLVNEPNVSDARILRCECNHRQQCKICERTAV